jgi:hypothetical protein
MMESTAAAFESGVLDAGAVQRARVRECLFVQPYSMWLLRVARNVAPAFAAKLTAVFGAEEGDAARFE